MKKVLPFLLAFICFCFCQAANATLSASTIWEVENAGVSTNGGGYALAGNTYDTNLAGSNANTATPTVSTTGYTFVTIGDAGNYLYIASGTNWIQGYYKVVSCSAGVATLNKACATVASPTGGSWSMDYTQQGLAHFSGTDLAVNAITNTEVSSGSYTFTQADVGNLIQISAGTGFTTGWYQIVSVATGIATLDRSPGAVSVSGGTWAEAGALANPSSLVSAMVPSNKAWVQYNATPYTNSAVLTFAQAAVTASATVPYTALLGYYQTRGDISPGVNAANRPSILTTTLAANGISLTNAGWDVENLILGPSGVATLGTILTAGGSSTRIINCKLFDYSSVGITINGSDDILAYCEVTGGTGGTGINSSGSRNAIYNNVCHDNANTAMSMGSESICANNFLFNNSGSGHPGISLSGTSIFCFHNTCNNNGGNGIQISTSLIGFTMIHGNLLANNGAYGLANTTAAWNARQGWDGNAYYNNTSGTRNNIDDKGAINPVDASAPYTNVFDVICTASPFINSTATPPDLRLNQNPGGGAACRGYGVPNNFPYITTPGYLDMGALQHRDPGFAN